MSDTGKSESESFETRSYDEIAAAIKSEESGSSQDATQTPAPGATQVDDTDDVTDVDDTTDESSQSDNTDAEPQTLEEARAIIAKERKERENAQKKLGEQGNELGDIRKEIASLKADKDTKPDTKTEEEIKSFVEVLKEDDAFKGMDDNSKQYLGLMFDRLESRILDRVTKAPEIQTLQQTVSQTQVEKIQAGWVQEAQDLQEAYGKELLEKHGQEISRLMTEAVQSGADPKSLSVKRLFKELAFDDLASGNYKRKTNADAKDELNEAARGKKTRKAPVVTTTRDYSKMSDKDAFSAMLEEDKKKGLVP